MKYILAIILTFIFVFSAMYLVISFTMWEFRPFGEWKDHQRAFFALLGILSSIYASAGVCAFVEEYKK